MSTRSPNAAPDRSPRTPPPATAYVRIAAELRSRILGKQLAPHTLLPSERELSDVHGVSRMTARHALALLESEGYVYRKRPRGTFVAESRVAFRIGSFSDEIIRMGKQPGAQVLSAERRHPTISAQHALGLRADDWVHALQRLRFADEDAIAIETTYFPEELTPGLIEQDLNGSLWEVLRREYGINPVHASATIESIVIDDPSCAHLQIRPASSGLLLTRWSRAEDGRCIEFARDVYRADRARFEVDAHIPPPP